jgi:ADP-ribosylglycohydrolase
MPPNPLPPLGLPPAATTTLLRTALQDRVAGVLVGSALGDTIGLYTEYLSASQAAAAYPAGRFTLTPESGGPTPFKLDMHRASKESGHWTDDTDHALLLLLAFLHTASSPAVAGAETSQPPPLPSQTDFAARLRVWVQMGLRVLDTMPLGLGRLVSSVVASEGFVEEPERVACETWKRTGKRVAPNGSLMRTHPLGVVCLFREEEEAFRLAADISRVTHFDPRCVVACVIGTGLVRGVVRGEVVVEEDVDVLINRAVQWFRDSDEGMQGVELDLEELKRHVRPDGGLDALNLDEQAAIGYAYKTLGSGVVLLRMGMRRLAASNKGLLERSGLFEDLITDLVMRGGDADTNACFAGALLGALLGYSALPDHWKLGLKHGEWLGGKSDALSQVLGLKNGSYNGREDSDTEIYGGRPMLSQEEMEARWMVLQAETAKKMKEAAPANMNASKPSKSRWSLPWQSKGRQAHS